MQLNQGFIVDSYHFYDIAKSSYNKTKQGFDIHRRNDAVVAIVFAALSLEAFINELGAIAENAKSSGYKEWFLEGLINAIDETSEDKKNTPKKIMMASNALGHPFDKGKNPYQDFALLFRLRDCLVHLKPLDRVEVDENNNFAYSGRKLIEELRSKKILQQHKKNKSITLLVSTAAAAKWACDTASAMVNAILDKIPDTEFSKDNEVLILYRNMFQPLEVDEQLRLQENYHHRQAAVIQADELRAQLLQKYGEFPDSVELLREDRSK